MKKRFSEFFTYTLCNKKSNITIGKLLLKRGNFLISLKGSRFLVSCENYESKVIINNGKEFQEITSELSEDDKDELIDDLIYAINDLLKSQEIEESVNESNENIERD